MLNPQDLLERCNEIRLAGGAEPIEALSPGIPSSARTCLIAGNLNFGCSIWPEITGDCITSDSYWYIGSSDVRINDVARALGVDTRVYLELTLDGTQVSWSFRLPDDLAASATAFDGYKYPDVLYTHGSYHRFLNPEGTKR